MIRAPQIDRSTARERGGKAVPGREGQFTQVHVERRNYRSLIACVQERKTLLCGVSTVTFMCVCDVPAASAALKACSCSVLMTHVHLKGKAGQKWNVHTFSSCYKFAFSVLRWSDEASKSSKCIPP